MSFLHRLHEPKTERQAGQCQRERRTPIERSRQIGRRGHLPFASGRRRVGKQGKRRLWRFCQKPDGILDKLSDSKDSRRLGLGLLGWLGFIKQGWRLMWRQTLCSRRKSDRVFTQIRGLIRYGTHAVYGFIKQRKRFPPIPVLHPN